MRAAMGRHERFRSALAAGFEAKDKSNLDWRRALELFNPKRDVSFAEHAEGNLCLGGYLSGAAAENAPLEFLDRTLQLPVMVVVPCEADVSFWVEKLKGTSPGQISLVLGLEACGKRGAARDGPWRHAFPESRSGRRLSAACRGWPRLEAW